MSTSTPTPTTGASAPDGPGSPGPVARLWQRQRALLLVALGLVAAVGVVVVLGGGARTGEPLDPANPGADGARALARVLDDQGVDVQVARGAEQLAATELGPGSTLLVVEPDLLGEDALPALLQRASDTRVVVAGAGPGVTAALGSSDLPGRVRLTDPRPADCDDPLLEGLRVEVDAAYAYPTEGCFPGRYGVLVARAQGVTLLGADQLLTNDQVLRADNAAVALRLLGQDQRLVWFVPSLTDLQADEGVSLRTLLPRWIQPALVLGVLVLLGLVLWRGRRLGALASEPLPVVVRAVETTDSLGRLYRRSGDRAHAAETLRRAARRRAGSRLRLGRRADPGEVVRAVARHLDRSEDEVAALLAPDAPAPATDPALVRLAHDLAALDREVRRP